MVEDYRVTLNKAGIRTRVVKEILFESRETTRLDTAKVIVAVGRGCCRPDDLELIQKLADKLSAVVAGSRPLVEEGVLPHTRQVGQSGITVSPGLYLAVGISGAIQHVVGMHSSKKVIAINQDPQAPIFKIADLGVVGDAREIIPRLIKDLEAISRSGGTLDVF